MTLTPGMTPGSFGPAAMMRGEPLPCPSCKWAAPACLAAAPLARPAEAPLVPLVLVAPVRAPALCSSNPLRSCGPCSSHSVGSLRCLLSPGSACYGRMEACLLSAGARRPPPRKWARTHLLILQVALPLASRGVAGLCQAVHVHLGILQPGSLDAHFQLAQGPAGRQRSPMTTPATAAAWCHACRHTACWRRLLKHLHALGGALGGTWGGGGTHLSWKNTSCGTGLTSWLQKAARSTLILASVLRSS